MINPNGRTVTLKLTRHEACDILLALSAADTTTCGETAKWRDLHSKVANAIMEHDERWAEK